MSQTEAFEQFLQKLQKSDTEKQVLIHEFTRELENKLKVAVAKDETLTPIADVVNELANEVARLRLEFQQLRDALKSNLGSEFEVLQDLKRVLAKY